MKKLLSIVLALSLCLTAMMGCFVVSAETTNKVTVETVKIMPETATTEVDVTFDFDDYFAASQFTVDFTGLALDAIDYDETVVSIAHGATDGDVDVFDGITSLTCILDAVNAEDLGAFTDVVITLTFDTAALAAGDYAITFTGDVAHAGTYDPDTGWTGDEDTIDYTATAGAIHVHTVVVDKAVDADCVNTGLTEGSHCSACEEVLVAQTETPATGEHNYVDGVCDVCGDKKVVEIEKFDLAGANMDLGNELAMNFFVNYADITTEGNYIEIRKTYANKDDYIKTIPQSEWGTGSGRHKVTFNGLTSKEMTDKIYVTVYNSEGVAISNTWEDSVVDYAVRALTSSKTKAQLKIVAVDMLLYGAAAQREFEYATDNLASAVLTDEWLALATPDVEITNDQQKISNFAGASLTLANNILLNFYFNNVTTDMYAEVSYTDFKGEPESYIVQGSEFVKNGTRYGPAITSLLVPDCTQLVTVKIYNSEGVVVAEGVDSVESYCARAIAQNKNESGLFTKVMNFAASTTVLFTS